MTTTTTTTDRDDTSPAEDPGTRSNPNFIDNDVDRIPDRTFRDYDLDDRVVDALEAQGITHPFPIQELTLPVALTGQDIIGQARTGTGKTLGFGLPMIERLDKDADHTQALIVTPTRELCIQVHDQLRICEAVGLTSTTVYGGVGYEEQTEALQGGVDIVVGTPGRLLDMLGRGILDLSRVSCVILDEADEMLDMGFLPDVERLLDAANPGGDRHTMLFSATMPATVVKLARRYTDSPLFMGADSVQHETAPTVEQHFFQVYRMDKPRVLARVLQQPDRGNAYVFTRTKAMADRLVRELGDLGVDAIAIHGDLRQAAREKNLTRFRDGRTSVLCATEVAARGIDVDNVTHVVNYDIPDDEKMYLHRIGRTARAGASGVAITFAEHNELARLEMIRKAVDEVGETPEVFSTSELLTELFDLPDETPWDHLASAASGSSGSRSSGSRSGGSRSGGSSAGGSRSGGSRSNGSRGRGQRTGDDARGSASRSRSRGGTGRDRVEHDSGGDEGRDRRRSRTVVRDDDSATGRDESTARRSGRDGDATSRSRSSSGGGRDRARDDDRDGRADGRDGGRSEARDGGRADARSGGRDGRSGGRDQATGSRRTAGGARVRARGGKPVDQQRDTGRRDGADGGSGGSSRTRDRARSRGGSGSGGGRSRGSSGSGSSGSGSSGRGGSRDDGDRRGGGRDGGDSTSRGGNAGRGGGNRNRGGRGGRSGGGRGRSGRGGSTGSQRGPREGHVELPTDVRPTSAGPAARGEGQPRHGRPVVVEDLA